ncbi:MAG: GTP pyrophosphokinase [Anaerolineae bacterium]|nr:GTP pyrophosphokinase [Anaerolineae bacterium]
MNLLERAIAIALEAHQGQTDRYGVPYIIHPLAVMMQMDSENEMMAAILHDVLEDSPLTLEYLRDQGFPAEVLEAVRLMTHDDESSSYQEYVRRLKPNPIAVKIKLADLRHNMDIRRMDGVKEQDVRRLEKYRRAWETLTS